MGRGGGVVAADQGRCSDIGARVLDVGGGAFVYTICIKRYCSVLFVVGRQCDDMPASRSSCAVPRC